MKMAVHNNIPENGLTIFYQNARSLQTKCLQLRQQIMCNDYDIIVITETWLHSGIFDGEFCDGSIRRLSA